MDNGPELTANAIRDWCRFGRTGMPPKDSTNVFSQGEPGSMYEVRPETRCSPSKPSTRCSKRNRDRRLENRLQHRKAAQQPASEESDRLRGRLEDLRQPDSHNEWTDKPGSGQKRWRDLMRISDTVSKLLRS